MNHKHNIHHCFSKTDGPLPSCYMLQHQSKILCHKKYSTAISQCEATFILYFFPIFMGGCQYPVDLAVQLA